MSAVDGLVEAYRPDTGKNIYEPGYSALGQCSLVGVPIASTIGVAQRWVHNFAWDVGSPEAGRMIQSAAG